MRWRSIGNGSLVSEFSQVGALRRTSGLVVVFYPCFANFLVFFNVLKGIHCGFTVVLKVFCCFSRDVWFLALFEWTCDQKSSSV